MNKKMTCRDLGGACDTEFTGTAEQIMKAGGDHLEATTDEAHVEAKKMMHEAIGDEAKIAAWRTDFMQKYEAAAAA